MYCERKYRPAGVLLTGNVVIYFRFKLLLLTYLLTYLLTQWCRVLLEKLIVFQPVKKFPELYGSRKFTTTITSVQHLSLFWASLFESMPLPTSRRSILILSSHLCPCLAHGSFHSVFPTKTVCTPLISPIRATCSGFLIPLDLIMTRQLVLSACTSTIFSLPPGLHPTQLSVCTSRVLTPSPGTCRKLPNINDMFYSKVNSAVSDWSRCFPKWLYHFELHIIWSAGTVVSWGMRSIGNSSSLQKGWCCEWQPRVCVRKHSETMVFMFCVPYILVLSEQRCSAPRV
jgi:hypothetical protein